MNKLTKIWTAFFIALAILITIFFALSITSLDGDKSNDYKLQQLSFSGEYSLNGGEWKQYDSSTKIKTDGKSKVVFRGKFNRTINENENVLMKIRFLEVNITRDGESIYKFGESGSYSEIMKSAGERWVRVSSSQITLEQTVEITLVSQYRNNYYSAFDDFMKNIYSGDSVFLLKILVQRDSLLLIGALFCLVFSILLFVMTIVLKTKKLNPNSFLFTFSLLMLFSSLWVLCSGEYMTVLVENSGALLMFQTALVILSSVMMVAYSMNFASKKVHWYFKMVEILMLSFLLVSVMLQLTGVVDSYEIMEYFIPFTGIVSSGIYLLLFVELLRAKGFWSKYIFIALLIFGVFMIMEWGNYIFEFAPKSSIFSIGLEVFVLMQIPIAAKQIVTMFTNESRVIQMKKELAENRVSMMLSQIRPHFLHNSLLAIKQLCDENPEIASEAIGRFSLYLRGNMALLSESNLISFQQELGHVKNYVYLEQMRFEERLKIQYDVGVEEFLIPPLTVQPIVENAIRCGVMCRQDGGKVIISSKETKDEIIVTIEDDGVGFDTSTLETDEIKFFAELEASVEHYHVGLRNVKERLAKQCGGRLEIKSSIGLGTVVSIYLPKKQA